MNYIKLGYLVLICFLFTSTSFAEEVTDSLRIEVDSKGKAKVNTAYMVNLGVIVTDTSKGITSNMHLIDPNQQALDYEFAKVKEWNGLFPKDIEWKGITRSFKESEIDLAELLPEGDWRNSRVIFKGSSLLDMSVMLDEILNLNFKPEHSDTLVLFLLDTINITNTIASFAVDFSQSSGNTGLADSLKAPAQLMGNVKDVVDNAGLFSDYCNVTIDVMERAKDILKKDFNIDSAPEIDTVLLTYKNYVKVLDQLKKALKITKNLTEDQKDVFRKKLVEMHDKNNRPQTENELKSAEEAIAKEFAKEYKNIIGDNDALALLIARYFIEPSAQLAHVIVDNESKKLADLKKENAPKIEIDKQKNRLDRIRYIRLILGLFDLALNSPSIYDAIMNDPSVAIPLLIKTGSVAIKDITSLLEYDVDKITGRVNKAVYEIYCTDVSLKTKINTIGSNYMKAISAGNTFANKLLPLLWDMALTPNTMSTSLSNGLVAPYGASSVSLKVFKKGNFGYDLIQEVKPETNSSVISVEDGDQFEIGVFVHKPLMFASDRAPWEVNLSMVPSSVFNILVASAGGYLESFMCGKKTFGNQKFSHNVNQGVDYIPISGACGAGSLGFIDDSWYNGERANSIIYSNALYIPQQYRLESASIPVARYAFTHRIGDHPVFVSVSGLAEGGVIKTVNFVSVKNKGFSTKQTISADGRTTLTVDASQIQVAGSDPIISYMWDWGDGTQSTSSTFSNSHTYKLNDYYFVKLLITTQSGAVFEHNELVNVGSLDVAPVITGLIPSNQTNSAYSLTLNWTSQQVESYDVYMAESTFGSPADLTKAVKVIQIGSASYLTQGSTTIDNLSIDKTYYFIVKGTKGTLSSISNERSYHLNNASYGKLNDTGIVTCGTPSTAATQSNSLECTDPAAATPAQQDGMNGRDYAAQQGTLTKVGGSTPNNGKANGFDFTKIGSNGQPLAIQNGTWDPNGSEAAGTKWDCVLDNVTGLLWEVKTDDNGLRDKDWIYSWYNSNPATNGGYAGAASRGSAGESCFASGRCDTEKYVADVNSAGLCGHNDWRMPTREELLGIADLGRENSLAIDTGYFPNTQPTVSFNYTKVYTYWSGSPYAFPIGDKYEFAWAVAFLGMAENVRRKNEDRSVILVRGK